MNFEAGISGLDELQAKMKRLTDDVQTKSVRFAARKAAEVLRNAARRNADRMDDPKTPQNIAKNITVQFASRSSRREGGAVFRVGVLGGARPPRGSDQARKTERRRAKSGQRSLAQMGELSGKGKGNPGGDTWYWRFVEFGTRRTEAKPFMRPVMQYGDTAMDEFFRHLNRRLDAQLKKL